MGFEVRVEGLELGDVKGSGGSGVEGGTGLRLKLKG